MIKNYVRVYSHTFKPFWAIQREEREEHLNLIHFTKCDKEGNTKFGINPVTQNIYLLTYKDIKKILPARYSRKYAELEIIKK